MEENKILTGKTSSMLSSMSVPISLGMLSTFLFQVIDTYFVGQLGSSALAALSFASTVYFILVGLFIGLAVGVSILVGQYYGAKELGNVKSIAWIGVWLSLVLAVVLVVPVLYFSDAIFSALGAGKEVLPLILEYLMPLLMGIPMLSIGLMMGSILRATGCVAPPEIIMGVAGVINLVLDYVLIFGHFGMEPMGIQGAAIATVVSWLFVLLAMLFLMFKKRLLSSRIGEKPLVIQVKQIVLVGLPTIATQIIGPLTQMFITFLLATQSAKAVAAYGVASRIEMLLLIGIMGVSTAITPFIAQNAGAGKKERIDEAIAYGGRASTYIGLLVAVLLLVFIHPIASLFSTDASVVHLTTRYFQWISFTYVFYGLFVITTSVFNGLQLPFNSLKIMLIKTLLFTLPLTFVGSYYGVVGIFAGIALGNVLGAWYAAKTMKTQMKKLNSRLAEVRVLSEYKKDLMNLVQFISKKR